MSPPIEAVQAKLGPYVEAIVACFRLGLEDYVREYASVRSVHSKRTQASLIHDHIVRRLQERFGFLSDAEGDLAVHRKGNLVQLIFRCGEFKLRIKKLGNGYRPKNIPTQTVINFNLQTSFDAIPEPINLYVGYRPRDDVSLVSSEIVCCCPNGNTMAWAWQVDKGDTDSDRTDNVIPLREKDAATKKKRRAKKRLTPEELEAKRKKEQDGDADEKGGPSG